MSRSEHRGASRAAPDTGGEAVIAAAQDDRFGRLLEHDTRREAEAEDCSTLAGALRCKTRIEQYWRGHGVFVACTIHRGRFGLYEVRSNIRAAAADKVPG